MSQSGYTYEMDDLIEFQNDGVDTVQYIQNNGYV